MIALPGKIGLTRYPMPNFLSGWGKRNEIIIDGTIIPSDLTQYQVTITLDSSFNFAHALSDGSDIRVTDSDGSTIIPYYISNWSPGTTTATIIVRVPLIQIGKKKKIYLYYGNGSPATFTLPPTGLFTRPTTAIHTGLGENMVYDPVSDAYYIVYCTTTAGALALSKSTLPTGPWTDQGVILAVGSGWESVGMYAPSLFLSSGTWYLYYSGSGVANGDNDSIGYATASVVTGPYTRFASNPVLTNSNTVGKFDRYRACEPFVYFSSILSKWVMLYMGDAGQGNTQIETVGYATATAPNGPWTRQNSGNPIIDFTTTPSWDSGTIADPFAVEINGVAYIGYTGSPTQNFPWNIGYVNTTDYITFTKIGNVYGYGNNSEFDKDSAFRGAISLVGSTWYQVYTGLVSQSGVFSWAIATMSAISNASGFDPWQVYDYYDVFTGSSLDTNKWAVTQPGSVSVSGGVLTLATVSLNTLLGRREFGVGYVIEVVCKANNAVGDSNHASEIGFASDDRSNTIRIYDFNNANWFYGDTGNSVQTNVISSVATDGSYHTRKVAFVSQTLVRFQVDSTGWIDITTNIPVISLPPWLFVFGATSMNVKSVIVRKYSSVEPTLFIGPETVHS